MLVSARTFEAPSLGASLSRRIVRHRSFFVKLVGMRGVVMEDSLVAPSRLAIVHGWPLLTIPVAGCGVVRSGRLASRLEARELAWTPSSGDYRARVEEHGVQALVVQWDPAVFGRAGDTAPVKAALGARDYERIHAVTRRIAEAGYDARRASAAAADLFAVLRSLGFLDTTAAAGDLLTPVDPHVVSAGAAIDRVLSAPCLAPAQLDIETAIARSPAHTRRLVNRYAEALRLQGARGWRDLLGTWRLYLGTVLMTAPRATTEAIARLLGYGSPHAFCHAFANAGLPAPGELRRITRALA